MTKEAIEMSRFCVTTKNNGGAGENVFSKAKIQQDYARVDIYYQTLDVKLISQIPAISVRKFSCHQIILTSFY